MAKPFSEWTVLPHGQLTRLEDNLACVTGVMRMPPVGDVERRMTVARLRDRRLVIYSAIALEEPEMRELEAFGTPAYLVVPSDLHRMDVKIWKHRYPKITVLAPAGARAKVEDVVRVDATSVDFGDDTVRFQPISGTGEREAALVVESGGGTSLVLGDLIFNIQNRTGISGWVWKVIGLTGDEPHIAAPVRMRQVKNKDALRTQLLQWSHLANLKRIIISHGKIITEEPARVLVRIANELRPEHDPRRLSEPLAPQSHRH